MAIQLPQQQPQGNTDWIHNERSAPKAPERWGKPTQVFGSYIASLDSIFRQLIGLNNNGVPSITLNYNGGAGTNLDVVAPGGWFSATQAFGHIDFQPPLAQNVSSLTVSALTDFSVYDSKTATVIALTGLALGHGGKNGCYLIATVAAGGTPGSFTDIIAVTTNAQLKFQ